MAKDILENADFDREFGQLGYALAELQASAPAMTTAVQNYIAGKIVGKFQERYADYERSFDPSDHVNSVRGKLPYSEFFARSRQAYLDVLAQPLDLSWGASAKNPQTGVTAGEMLPSAFRSTTVGGAMNWLGLSEIPGVLQSLGRPNREWRKNKDFDPRQELGPLNPEHVPGPITSRQVSDLPLDEFSAGWTRAYESIYQFEPVNPKTGRENNFSVWFNSGAQKGIREHRRAEKAWRAGNTPSSAFESDDDGESDSALDTASGIGTASRFNRPPQAPISRATGRPLDFGDYVTDMQDRRVGVDDGYNTFNAQTGRFGKSRDSSPSLQVFGIDPESPAGKAGMKEGAFIQSLQHLFERDDLADYVDALENGQTASIGVIQPDEAGQLVEQVLSIQPGSMRGRGFTDSEEPGGNWIDDLANRVDPESGVSVGHMRGRAVKGPDGKYVYQSLPAQMSPVRSRGGLPTNLYTTSEKYSAGMYQDAKGNWKLAPISTEPSDEYSVPVAMTPGTMRQFGKLYDQWNDVWAAHRQAYGERLPKAQERVFQRLRRANANARFDEVRSARYELEVMKEAAQDLPEGVSLPGTPMFSFWTSAEAVMGELRDFERSTTSVSPEYMGGRTIEQFDAWASSQLRYTNPAVYGLDQSRMARARRIVSSDRNVAQRMGGGHVTPGRPANTLVDAVYNQLSSRDLVSAFPLGSMNEDDWDYRKNAEERPVREDTYDNSLLGGDTGTPEFEGELADLAKDRVRAVTSRAGTPIYDRTTKQVIGYTGDYGETRTNTITQQAALPRRKLTTVTPAFTYPSEGVEAVNARSSDPVIARRMHASADRDEDRELEEASDEVSLGESERRFQQALSVIEDPDAPGASLSAAVSSAGNKSGFFSGQWGDLFSRFSARDRAHRETYWALHSGDEQAAAGVKELQDNLSVLFKTGHKDYAMRARLGEEPGLKRYERESLRQVSEAYNLDLSWQSGKESELFDQVAALAKDNPEGFQAVKSLFASQPEQLRLARQYMSQAAQAPSPRDSHVYQTPGGRAHAKWSPNQMSRRNIDPETGFLDPTVLENTPPPVRARGGGSVRAPRMAGLNALQNSIAYENFQGEQMARLSDQARTYASEYMKTGERPEGRERFDLIMPYNAADDEDGMRLDMMLGVAGDAVKSVFGGFDVGEMELLSDPDLPEGYARIGAYVSEQAGGRAESEPPEAPPADTPPPPPPTAAPSPNGRRRNRYNERLPEGHPGALPASFPRQAPGAEGWKMTFNRDTKSHTAWGRVDAGGNLQWMVRNNDGEMEPLRNVPGYGRVWNEKDELINDVSWADFSRHEGMGSPVAGVSSAGNNTSTPARDPDAPQKPRRSRFNLDAQALTTFSYERPGYTRQFNDFARRLGGETARDFIQSRMESDASWSAADPEARDNAFQRASTEYREKVLDAWEHFGGMADDYTTDDVAEYLAREFGGEDTQTGPLRAAALEVTGMRRETGTWSERVRVIKRNLGNYSPALQGMSMEDVRAAQSGDQRWKAVAMAKLERSYTPENVFAGSRGRVGGVGRMTQESLGPGGEGEEIFGFGMAENDPVTGEVVPTATHGEMRQAMGLAQSAFVQGSSGALPTTPNEKLATVKSRAQKHLNEFIEQMAKDLEKAEGVDPTEARAHVQKIKDLGNKALQHIVGSVQEAMGDVVGESDFKTVSAIQYGSTRVHGADKAREIFSRSQAVRDQFGGANLEEVMKSREDFFATDEEGSRYNFGGVSSAGNMQQRIGGALGMFGGGRFGSLFYGAYMLKREWQMAAAPTFQAAQKYGESLSAYAPLLYEGSALSGTDAGFAFRQEAGEAFMGRAAYSSYGAFMDIPYRLSQSGNMSAARMLQTAGIAGGIAGSGLIGGSMLTMSGMAAAGGVLATGGLIAGAGLLAGVAGMEVYNQFFKPEGQEDLTPSSVIDYLDEQGDIAKANTRRVKEKFGDTYEEFKARYPGQTPVSRQAWQNARAKELNIRDGSAPTLEDVKPWLGESAAKYEAKDEAENLAARVKAIRGETLEDENAVLKALQIQKRFTGDYDTNQLMQVSRTSALLGIGSDESLQQGAAYAGQLGYLEGTPDYTRAMMDYANIGSREERAGAQYTASRVSQLGSQVQAVMGSGSEFAGLGSRLVSAYGLTSQQQVGVLASMAGGMQQYGADFAPFQYDLMAGIVRDNNPFTASVIGNAMQGFMAGGASLGQAMNIGGMLSSAGMSAQDASVYARMQQGDLGAYSYQAWQSRNGSSEGNMDNAFQDRAGRSIMQHNGGIGMQVYNAWAPKVGMGALSTGQFLNTGNQEIISSFESGGFYGLQKLANEKSYAASMASIGVQLKGIALQENFYWGANTGGTWDNPASSSAWGIENRQLALQDQSARANFADQWARMTLQNNFSIRRENNQQERMGISNAYQNWNWSANYNQFQQSQTWARQDWQYQDTTRGLQNGWQMEDLNEAIRFSSGRERKQLIRQRDRAALSQNLEEEQVETQRDRQEELWAQQEERYQKERAYMLENQRLDQESFDLNKEQREEFYKLDVAAYQRRLKEYEEEKKLSDELRELQRKFQYDQLQLSKEAAGAQAAAAAAQKEINDAIAEGQKKWEELTGTVQQMNQYDNAFRIARATEEMMAMMNTVNTNKIDKLMALLRAISEAAPQQRAGGERE